MDNVGYTQEELSAAIRKVKDTLKVYITELSQNGTFPVGPLYDTAIIGVLIEFASNLAVSNSWSPEQFGTYADMAFVLSGAMYAEELAKRSTNTEQKEKYLFMAKALRTLIINSKDKFTALMSGGKDLEKEPEKEQAIDFFSFNKSKTDDTPKN